MTEIKNVDRIEFKRMDKTITSEETKSILNVISNSSMESYKKYKAPVEFWYMKDGTVECASVGILPSKRIRDAMKREGFIGKLKFE